VVNSNDVIDSKDGAKPILNGDAKPEVTLLYVNMCTYVLCLYLS